jgi:16S rRNA U1498 N3-methylase RsmE
VNVERLRANAIEAAEQTERLTVPEVREPVDSSAARRVAASGAC